MNTLVEKNTLKLPLITDSRILGIIKDCKENLANIGYNIGDDIYYVFENTLRAFGTLYLPEYETGNFTLALHQGFIKESDENKIKNTLYHEFAHYINNKDLMENGVMYWSDEKDSWVYSKKLYDRAQHSSHGSSWKRIAAYISKKLNLSPAISTTNSFDYQQTIGNETKNRREKYIIRCKNCGQEYKYAKQTTFVKDPNVKMTNGKYRYWCGKCHAEGQFEKVVNEAIEVSSINPYTCGYIKEDGTLLQLDAYHGEEQELRNKKYVEYSNTHPEEDTCVRIYKEPTAKQYEQLEKIIDFYLDNESYCKIEIWTDYKKYTYYKAFSLYEGACGYSQAEEVVGNWTGYKLIQIIKNQFKNSTTLKEALEDQTLYHGSGYLFDNFHNPINWCSPDKKYCEMFAKWLHTEHAYIYTVKVNIKNPIDVGDTSEPIFNLFPITPPYKLSAASKKICAQLNVDDEIFANLAQYTSAGDDSKAQYKLKLHAITRTTEFKELAEKARFDSIKAVEDGSDTYGVFDPTNIKIIKVEELH